MKINGIEQLNIGTEEEPYWVPKDKPLREIAEDWADEQLKGINIDNFNGVYQHHMLTGEPIYARDGVWYTEMELGDKINEIDYAVTIKHLSAEEIVKRYSHLLSDKDREELGYEQLPRIQENVKTAEEIYDKITPTTPKTHRGYVDRLDKIEDINQILYDRTIQR